VAVFQFSISITNHNFAEIEYITLVQGELKPTDGTISSLDRYSVINQAAGGDGFEQR